VLVGSGTLAVGSTMTFSLNNAAPNALSFLGLGFSRLDLPLFGGVVVPNFNTLGVVTLFTTPGGTGSVSIGPIPAGFASGTRIYAHWWTLDPAGPQGFAASNAIYGVFP